MEHQNERIQEIIHATLEQENYLFQDYERALRFAIAWRVANGEMDASFDEASQMLNLYHLLWQLKPYFKQ